jgi:hypothetical protein
MSQAAAGAAREVGAGSSFPIVRSLEAALEPVVVCCALIASLAVVFEHPWAPWADQLALMRCASSSAAYPAWTSGLTSCGVSLVARSISGADPLRWNTAMRAIACALYLLSSAMLAHRALHTVAARMLATAFVVASLYPFVWLSSELVFGAALMIALLATSGRDPRLAGVALCLLAFAKPEAIVTALALLAVRTFSVRKDALVVLVTMLAGCAALLLPGIFTRGPAYLLDLERATSSFGQHAHILFSHERVWVDGNQALDRYFPGATSAWDALRLYPARYLDYVRLSAREGLRSIRLTFGPFVWAMGLAAVGGMLARAKLEPLVQRFAVALVGFVPIVLLSFPHARYLARYLPLAMIALLALVEQLWRHTHRPQHVAIRWIVTAGVIWAAASYTHEAFDILAESHTLALGTPFWSAD